MYRGMDSGHFSIAAVKTTPPRSRNRQLERKQLLERVRSAHQKLILVRAPTGFGKSTLLEQLRDHYITQGISCAWVSLDSRDSDQNVLVPVLMQALHDALPAFDPSRPRTSESLFAELLEHVSSLQQQFILFLDDIDALASKESRLVIRHFLNNTPDSVRVVIAGRSIPPVGQSRLRLLDEVLDLSGEDLRFQLEETSTYINTRLPQKLTPTELKELHQMTDGWAAAVQLACLSIQASGNSNQLTQALLSLNDSMAEYLHEAVLDHQPADIQRFLVETSVLRILTGELCDAVAGRSNSEQILYALEGEGFLLRRVVTQDGRRWYSFHSLFSDFLQQQLLLEGKGIVSKLCQRASQWYGCNGMLIDAAEYARRAGDEEQALEYLDKVAMSYIWRGQLNTVLAWCENLPLERVERYEQLFGAYLWAEAYAGNPDRALKRLNDLRSFVAGKPISTYLADTLLSLPTLIAAARHDTQTMIETGPKALQGFAARGMFEYRAVANCVTYGYLSSGQMGLALQTHAVAKSTSSASEASWGYVYTLMNEGHIRLNELRLDKALAALQTGYEETSATYSELSQSSAIAASFYVDALYEAGQLEQANLLLKRHLPMISSVIAECITIGYGTAVRLAIHGGEYERAREILFEVEALASRRDAMSTMHEMRWLRAWLYVLTGDHDEARLLLLEQTSVERGFPTDVYTPVQALYQDLYRIRIQISLGMLNGLDEEIDVLIERAERRSEGRRHLRLRILKARLFVALGEAREAETLMRELLRFALPRQFVQCFFDEGLEIVALVHKLASQLPIDPIIQAKVKEALPPQDRRKPSFTLAPVGRPVLPDLVCEKLTQRETDLLIVVEKGLTNREIADCFALSENTVKWHLQNIFNKLGVSNRTEAAFLLRQG